MNKSQPPTRDKILMRFNISLFTKLWRESRSRVHDIESHSIIEKGRPLRRVGGIDSGQPGRVVRRGVPG